MLTVCCVDDCASAPDGPQLFPIRRAKHGSQLREILEALTDPVLPVAGVENRATISQHPQVFGVWCTEDCIEGNLCAGKESGPVLTIG
jgi:hypothetical protein